MACADIFTAITEDRPYRTGMNRTQAKQVFDSMVNISALDGDIVSIVCHHYDEIDEVRRQAQETAAEQYRQFILHN